MTLKSEIPNGTPDVTLAPHGIENFNQLVDLRCLSNGQTIRYSFDGYTFLTNLYNMSNYTNIKNGSIRAYLNGANICIDAGYQWKSKVITVIVEYTKTA